jgi:hypothetical protein
MSRRDVVREVVESLADRDNAVAYPDHPLLVRGPDVLAGLDDGLTAFFLYTEDGLKPGSPVGRARTLLSRLALPQDATFVLVVPSADTALRDDDLELFDAVQYGTRSRGRTRRQWEVFNHRAAALARQLPGFHLQRFAEAWATRDSGVPRRPSPQIRGLRGM